jgi:hypothetical protein
MFRIALEAANLVGVFLDDADQSASRFAIETNRRNDLAALLDFTRPLRGVVLHPVIPFFHGWIVGEAAAGGF